MSHFIGKILLLSYAYVGLVTLKVVVERIYKVFLTSQRTNLKKKKQLKFALLALQFAVENRERGVDDDNENFFIRNDHHPLYKSFIYD